MHISASPLSTFLHHRIDRPIQPPHHQPMDAKHSRPQPSHDAVSTSFPTDEADPKALAAEIRSIGTRLDEMQAEVQAFLDANPTR